MNTVFQAINNFIIKKVKMKVHIISWGAKYITMGISHALVIPWQKIAKPSTKSVLYCISSIHVKK